MVSAAESSGDHSPAETSSGMAIGGRTRLLLLVLACLILLFHIAVFAGWIIDDAYVSFRYAHNLVHGRGLVFNPGERIEGYTNFSWTILTAGFIALGLQPDVFMPVVGVISGIGLLLYVAREGRRLAEVDGLPHPYAGVPAALILACSTGLALYSVAGLEMAFLPSFRPPPSSPSCRVVPALSHCWPPSAS